MPTDGPTDLEDLITHVAEDYFEGKSANAAFEVLIGGFEYQQRATLWSAVWALVNAHQDAAYTFRAAVGLQLASRQPPVPARGKKSGAR